MSSEPGSISRALEPYMSSEPTDNVVPFRLPDWVFNSKPDPAFDVLLDLISVDTLAAGLETNIEEIRSAVMAILPAAISTEPEWMKLARGLAYEARVYNKKNAEELWEILDAASRRAPGYDQEENRSRWLRYVDEALGRENPITIGTVLNMALDHGWPGWFRR